MSALSTYLTFSIFFPSFRLKAFIPSATIAVEVCGSVLELDSRSRLKTSDFNMCQRMEIVDDTLRTLFRKLGRCIGNRPGYFVIVPILISALCASGFQRIVFEADPEYLFSPVDGEVSKSMVFLKVMLGKIGTQFSALIWNQWVV